VARPDSKQPSSEVTRREFVASVGIAASGVALGLPIPRHVASPRTVAASEAVQVELVSLSLSINRQETTATIDPRVTLLDYLREDLGFTGTKKGCDHGQCGACTVLVNGVRINSCLSLAVVHDGDEVTTIEGIAQGEELHPVQAAFLEHDGLQCGYCTPGQICSAVALLQEAQNGDVSFVTKDLTAINPVTLTPDEIRERMSGNICRCGAYPGIVAAVQAAYSQAAEGE
jgi:xanthine dehydrogenase YagT iron-sulfur-binding subunit